MFKVKYNKIGVSQWDWNYNQPWIREN